MGIFKIFKRKKELPESDFPDVEEPMGEDLPDGFKPAFDEPFPESRQPFMQYQSQSTDSHQLILTKLDLINQRLEVIDRRLQAIEEIAKRE